MSNSFQLPPRESLPLLWLKSIVTCGIYPNNVATVQEKGIENLTQEANYLQLQKKKVESTSKIFFDELSQINEDTLAQQGEKIDLLDDKLDELSGRIELFETQVEPIPLSDKVNEIGVRWIRHLGYILGSLFTLGLVAVIRHAMLKRNIDQLTQENDSQQLEISRLKDNSQKGLRIQINAIRTILDKQLHEGLKRQLQDDNPGMIEQRIQERSDHADRKGEELETLKVTHEEERRAFRETRDHLNQVLKSSEETQAEKEQERETGRRNTGIKKQKYLDVTKKIKEATRQLEAERIFQNRDLGPIPAKYSSNRTIPQILQDEPKANRVDNPDYNPNNDVNFEPIYDPIFENQKTIQEVIGTAFTESFKDLLLGGQRPNPTIIFNKSNRILLSQFQRNRRALINMMAYRLIQSAKIKNGVCSGIDIWLNRDFQLKSSDPYRVLTVDETGYPRNLVMFDTQSPFNPQIGDQDVPEGVNFKDAVLLYREKILPSAELSKHVKNMLTEDLIKDDHPDLVQTKQFVNTENTPNANQVKLFCTLVKEIALVIEKRYGKIFLDDLWRINANDKTQQPLSKHPDQEAHSVGPQILKTLRKKREQGLSPDESKFYENLESGWQEHHEKALLLTSDRIISVGSTPPSVWNQRGLEALKSSYYVHAAHGISHDDFINIIVSMCLLKKPTVTDIKCFKSLYADVLIALQNRLSILSSMNNRNRIEESEFVHHPINDLVIQLTSAETSLDQYIKWLKGNGSFVNISTFLIYKIEIKIMAHHLLNMKIGIFTHGSAKTDEEGILVPTLFEGPDTTECLKLGYFDRRCYGFVEKLRALPGDDPQTVSFIQRLQRPIVR